MLCSQHSCFHFMVLGTRLIGLWDLCSSECRDNCPLTGECRAGIHEVKLSMWVVLSDLQQDPPGDLLPPSANYRLPTSGIWLLFFSGKNLAHMQPLSPLLNESQVRRSGDHDDTTLLILVKPLDTLI